jgi:hypothetical protein
MEDVQPVLADEAIDESLQHDHHDPNEVASTMANELPVLTALAASNAATEPAQQQRYAPQICVRSSGHQSSECAGSRSLYLH